MNLVTIFYFVGFVVFCLSVAGLLLHAPFALFLRKFKQDEAGFPSIDNARECEYYHLIQLPVYNESPATVLALLQSASRLDYPCEKFCIQLLDDSDLEDISTVLRQHVHQIKLEHPQLQIQYLHRQDRSGFKAGNLNYGLQQFYQSMESSVVLEDTGKICVSIFDADFDIPPQYLKTVEGYFGDPQTGIVQTNTCFRNSSRNWLTRVQTVFQNNLQFNEFAARSRAGHLSTFRGSAGTLRLGVIEECGLWQGNTQIEDADLSFRAQAYGWKVVYDNSVVCSSLLPEKYSEYKLQQRSWVKGLMEVMRKQIGAVLHSKKLSVAQKLGGLDFFFVLSLQSIYLTASHLSLIPAYNFFRLLGAAQFFDGFMLVFLVLLLLTHTPLFVHDSTGNTHETGKNESSLGLSLYSFLIMVAMFSTFTVGLFEGLFGRKVYRDRTGKGGKEERKSRALPPSSVMVLKNINRFEWVMTVYSLFFTGWALSHHHYIVAVVYGVFPMVYPVNSLVSLIEIIRVSK